MKKLLIRQSVIFLILLLFGVCFHTMMFRYFKRLLIDNNQVIAVTILEKHPELENELVEAMITADPTNTKKLPILEKYDLDDIDALDELSFMKQVKETLFYVQLLYLITAFLFLSVPFLSYFYHEKKRMREIRDELSKVLNDDFYISLSDYEEGELSNLKNDLQKMIVMLRDYSESMHQDKLALEQTLSDISHQLKTPLTSMYMVNDLLMNDHIEPEKKKELLLKNKKQLERIEWLVTSLLKISRLDSGVIQLKRNSVSAQKLIEDALAPLLIPIELKNQTVKVDCDVDTFFCDRHWTMEALINLLKNAHEHTKENGMIQISVKENPIYTVITIQDNGEGISKKDLPHIFKRFYKTNEKSDSIGIGLNMAKMIVEKQNGTISVTSKKNVGTTFTLKFYKTELLDEKENKKTKNETSEKKKKEDNLK